MKNNYKNEKNKVPVENLIQHPYHREIYQSISSEFLEESVKRTGHKPIYPIVVVPNPTETHIYYVVSGMARLETQKRLGQTKVDVQVYNITDDTEIQNLIVDLNKSRPKDGQPKSEV